MQLTPSLRNAFFERPPPNFLKHGGIENAQKAVNTYGSLLHLILSKLIFFCTSSATLNTKDPNCLCKSRDNKEQSKLSAFPGTDTSIKSDPVRKNQNINYKH